MITGSPEGTDTVTEGGSEYKGDMFIDLDTRVERKATLDEFVVTEMGAADASIKAHRYTVRHLLLHLINRQEFENG
jgi:hypothetical protein